MRAAAATPAGAVTFNVFDQGGVSIGAQVYNGFTAAAHFWEKVLTNNAAVNRNVQF